MHDRGMRGRSQVEVGAADAPKEISVEKEKNDLKKFLEQERKLTNLVSDIFSDQLMDEIYRELDDFEQMVIWCTYPELTLEEIEIIGEMMVEGYSAEEILEYMELEDRSNIMEWVIRTLCQIDRGKWKEFLTERMIEKSDQQGYAKYNALKNEVMLVQSGRGVLTSKRLQEGKTKTWKIFENMPSADW